MGAGATGGALSIMGGILGGIGDIYTATHYKKRKFPGAKPQEERLRRFTMQDLANARENIYGGAGLYNQALPFMLGAIPGYSAEVVNDPQSSEAFDQLYGAAQERLSQRGALDTARATLRGAKGKVAKKAARQGVKAARRTLKGGPTLDQLRRQLNTMQATPAQLRISKNAPTETDINAQSIQDELSNRTLAALHGELPNPTLENNLARERMQMEDHMRAQLGPDWENSTAGIQAVNQFDQYANDQRDMSNRRDIAQLYPEQLYGQQAQYGFAGNQQQLLGSPTLEQLRFGNAMAQTGQMATGAQSPYQFDRSGLWQQIQGPNKSDVYGAMMAQSGDRWASIGSSIGGQGGQQSSMPAPQQGGGGGYGSQAYAVD